MLMSRFEPSLGEALLNTIASAAAQMDHAIELDLDIVRVVGGGHDRLSRRRE
jgi:hypothetical protein